MKILGKLFEVACGAALVGWMAAWFPLGVANRSTHDPSCTCDYCDPSGRKARRLGVRRS